jgi:hypothetical protein
LLHHERNNWTVFREKQQTLVHGRQKQFEQSNEQVISLPREFEIFLVLQVSDREVEILRLSGLLRYSVFMETPVDDVGQYEDEW